MKQVSHNPHPNVLVYLLRPELSLIEALGRTPQDLEKDQEFSTDDPAFMNLKAILLQRIADLQREAGEIVPIDAAASQTAD